MAPRSRAPAKKHTLTLAHIASYDDILTDALVDHAFYWTTIPKNRPSYLPSRGLKEDEIGEILQKHLIVTPDMQVAEEKLLATNGLQRFYNALKTDAEKDDFCRHLRRYMQIYLPDSPFEVTTTNRYTIFQEEASICARRFIKCNETIKYLSGIQVVITAEEEAQLSARKKDFSIVVSSRKKEVNLFMGPARFANHDCDANARLVTTGQAGIEIIATKSIGVGDEITVTYGDSYFGENNCECLCKTCEDNLVNGWAPADGSLSVKPSIEDRTGTPVQGYSLRRRDDNSYNRGHSETPSLTPIARPKVLRASLRKLVRSTGGDGMPMAGDTPASEPLAARSPSIPQSRGQKRTIDAVLSTPPVTPAKKAKTEGAGLSDQAGDDLVPTASTGNGNVASAELAVLSPTPKRVSTADTIQVLQESLDEPMPMTNHMPTPESTHESDVDEADNSASAVAGEGPSAFNQENTETTIVVRPLPTPELSSADSGDDDEVIVVSMEPEAGPVSAPAPSAPRRGRPRKRPAGENASAPASPQKGRRGRGATANAEANKNDADNDNDNDNDNEAEPKRQRVPGDYTLTPLLLAEPETAWVICMVCNKAFVQRNAYFTRMSCPRCERHSKLYGYVWPKTEPEGKGDKEERILDHRLVHRFLHAEDEAKIRGRKWPAAWRRDGSAAGGEEDGHEAGRSGRRGASASGTGTSSRGSGIWRTLRYTVAKEQKPTKTKTVKAAVSPAKRAAAPKATKPAGRPRAARAVPAKKAFAGTRRGGRGRRAGTRETEA